MPLVIAAIAPHSPLLVKSAGGQRTPELEPSIQALEELAVELAQARIETIVAIGDHGQLRPEAMTLAQPAKLSVNLREFGDIVTAREFMPDIRFGNSVRSYGETNLPLLMVAPEQLSYVVGVPLMLLAAHLPNVRVSCFGPALLPAADHVALGAVIRHEAENTPTRVALVAAGDLTGGNAQFDAAVQSAVRDGKLSNLASDPRWADAEQGIVWRNLATLAGALEPSSWTTEILASQREFGTGLLTAAIRP